MLNATHDFSLNLVIYHISQIVLNIAWQVVAGEDSKEVETQKQREMRVLEAVYPRPSAIPPKFDACLTIFFHIGFHACLS